MSKVYTNFNELEIFILIKKLCTTEYESIEQAQENQRDCISTILELTQIRTSKTTDNTNTMQNMQTISDIINMMTK